MTLSMVLIVMAVLAGGVILGAGCVVLGAWMAFRVRRTPGEGAGFIKDPKGEVFSIRDDVNLPGFPGVEDPTEPEKHILKKAERFLETMGGNHEG